MDIDYDELTPGCYIGGHRGHYATADMILEFSNNKDELDLAGRYEDEYWCDDYPFESLADAADACEHRLSEALSAVGKACGWFDGEFFVWLVEDDEFATK